MATLKIKKPSQMVKKTKKSEAADRAIQKAKEKLPVRFIIVMKSDPTMFFPSMFMDGPHVEYCPDMASVVKYLKDHPTSTVRVFEVSTELKTRSHVELDI